MPATYSAIPAEAQVGTGGHRRRRPTRGRKDGGYVGQAGWASSVVNLVNTIIGAGVLAMPLALSHMGILLGSSVIIWAGLTAGFGLYLQTRCARYLERGTASFFALSQLTYPNAAVIFDAAIAIKCFGVGVSYLIIIGDLMPGVVEAFGPYSETYDFLYDRRFWITAFMFVIIPLCYLRRLDSLRYTSFIALVAIGYLVILVLAHLIKGDVPRTSEPIRVIRWAGVLPTLSSFPVTVFAYTCHQNMFPILNELKVNSHARTTGVVAASIGSACSVYLLVAIAGYLTFGDSVAGNIVSMYPPSTASTISKGAIVVFFMLSYPLQIHPCRASVDAVLRWRPSKSRSALHDPSNSSPSRHLPLLPSTSTTATTTTPTPPPTTMMMMMMPTSSASSFNNKRDAMSETRFAILSTTIIVMSYLTAMTVSSLERVLAYVGSTGSTSISFILPGLFYYKISDPDSLLHQKFIKEDDDVEGVDDDRDRGSGGGYRYGYVDADGSSSDPEHPTSTTTVTVENGGRGRGNGGGFLCGLLLFSPSSFVRSSATGAQWRKKLLRRLSLGLAIYGVVVMIVCLITHTFFVVLH
ncbi:MAG: hypothetical protein M1815_003251 [Lichina confinis]|nr:MAG: hypothetical protein M1815_003251 [Lichina confinis]